jgi:hypothetical protein
MIQLRSIGKVDPETNVNVRHAPLGSAGFVRMLMRSLSLRVRGRRWLR